MQTSGHHRHRSLRPSTASNFSNNNNNNNISQFTYQRKPNDIGKGILQPRAPPSSSLNARPTYYAKTTSSGRSNRFTSEFVGRGFYRDTSMAGYRRQQAIEKLNEERRRKHEQLLMLKKNKMDGDAVKEKRINVKREWLKEKRIESSENRDMENKSVIKIQSHMRGHLSRRRVAKLRVEIYDNDSTNAAIKIQSVHRGRKARQEILNGVNNTNTSLSNTNTRTSNVNGNNYNNNNEKYLTNNNNNNNSNSNDYIISNNDLNRRRDNNNNNNYTRPITKARPQSARVKTRQTRPKSRNQTTSYQNDNKQHVKIRPGTSTGSYRTKKSNFIPYHIKKNTQRKKNVWVPSSASPRSYRPRPLTAPSQNMVVSPETFRRTGGGFTKYTLEESDAINNANVKDIKNMKKKRQQRRGRRRKRGLQGSKSRNNNNKIMEVKQYAEKQRIKAERAILIRVERELKESTRFNGDPIGLHKKAKQLTLKILKRKEKLKLKQQKEWELKRAEAERERQRRILLAKEMAKPYQPPSLHDDEDGGADGIVGGYNNNRSSKSDGRRSASPTNINMSNQHKMKQEQKVLESIDLLSEDSYANNNNNARKEIHRGHLSQRNTKEIVSNPTRIATRPPSSLSKPLININNDNHRAPSTVSDDMYDDDDAFEVEEDENDHDTTNKKNVVATSTKTNVAINNKSNNSLQQQKSDGGYDDDFEEEDDDDEYGYDDQFESEHEESPKQQTVIHHLSLKKEKESNNNINHMHNSNNNYGKNEVKTSSKVEEETYSEEEEEDDEEVWACKCGFENDINDLTCVLCNSLKVENM